MDELMFKIQQDEEFFKKVSGGENMPTCQDCKHYNQLMKKQVIVLVLK
jgi:hypothetical protein